MSLTSRVCGDSQVAKALYKYRRWIKQEKPALAFGALLIPLSRLETLSSGERTRLSKIVDVHIKKFGMDGKAPDYVVEGLSALGLDYNHNRGQKVAV